MPGVDRVVVGVVVAKEVLQGQGLLEGADAPAVFWRARSRTSGGEVLRQFQVGLHVGPGVAAGLGQVGRRVAGDLRLHLVDEPLGRLLLGQQCQRLGVDPGALEVDPAGPVGGRQPERVQRADAVVLHDLVGQRLVARLLGQLVADRPVRPPRRPDPAVELLQRREPPVGRDRRADGEQLGHRVARQPGLDVDQRADGDAGRVAAAARPPQLDQRRGAGRRAGWGRARARPPPRPGPPAPPPWPAGRARVGRSGPRTRRWEGRRRGWRPRTTAPPPRTRTWWAAGSRPSPAPPP